MDKDISEKWRSRRERCKVWRMLSEGRGCCNGEIIVKRTRWKAEKSFSRIKCQKDWLSWPKVRKGEKADVEVRLFGWMCCNCCFLGRRYPRELIRANVDTGWVIHVDQCSETIATAIHLPLCPEKHGAYGGSRETSRFATWLHARSSACSSVSWLS